MTEGTIWLCIYNRHTYLHHAITAQTTEHDRIPHSRTHPVLGDESIRPHPNNGSNQRTTDQ
eukprot:12886769-Prorocentrum_lima.AAC.1